MLLCIFSGTSMVPGILGPTMVAFPISLPLGQSPCSRLFLWAHLSIKTPILYSIRVILCVGLPHDESLVDKWIVLLDLNDISFLMQVMGSLKDFLNRQGVMGGGYFKTLVPFIAILEWHPSTDMCKVSHLQRDNLIGLHMPVSLHNCVQNNSSSHRKQWGGF